MSRLFFLCLSLSLSKLFVITEEKMFEGQKNIYIKKESKNGHIQKSK